MRKLKEFFLKAGAVVSAAALTPLAFAQSATPPTSAVALAQGVNLDDAKSAGLIIIGLLVVVGVTLWGASLILARFKPK